MSVIKNRDSILEAIDQLRRRKARPDRERICSYVSRKTGSDNRSIIADLERLADEQVVVKVEYKGSISYRNAAKWSKLSVHISRIEVELSDLNKLESMQDEPERMSNLLRGAITELVCRDPDYLDHGVPVFELENYLKTKDSEFFARISFNVLLTREVKVGTVVKLENGNYLLGPHGARPRSGPTSTMSGSWSGSTSDVDDVDESTLMEDIDVDVDGDRDADSSAVKSPTSAATRLPPLPPLVPAPALLRQRFNGAVDADGDVVMDSDDGPSAANRSMSPMTSMETEHDHEMDEDELGPEPELDPEPDPEPQPEPGPEPDPEPDPAMNHKDQEESTGYRLGERRKRAKKKVFDPSDNNLPKAKRRGRPSAIEKAMKASLQVQPPAAPSPVAASSLSNGTSSTRTSSGPATTRVSNGPVAQKSQNGSAANRTSNGPAAFENTVKDVKAPVPSNNKLNAIGTGPVAVCAKCICAIVDGKAIQCKDCTQKAHFSCLIRGNRARFRPNSWQCMTCKTCQICLLTEDSGTIVVCTNCDEGYHVKCHIPKPKIPWKKWICCRCAPPEPKQTTPEKATSPMALRLNAYNELTVNSIMQTLPQLLQPKIEELEMESSKVDVAVPDASCWSTDDVFEFFFSKYPDYASVFKDQDIDGPSLLLMTRNDVVNGLNLKLGPALKIYSQVKKLQLRCDSSQYIWE